MISPPSDIPPLPGIYRFHDAYGCVLYVGKAKSLKSRLAQYFPSDSSLLHPRTAEMVSRAQYVTVTVVSSEAEALLAEANLIKSLQPPFNVRLRDDHSYPSVVLSGHVTPRVFISRSRDVDGDHFGPFPTPQHARSLLQAVSIACGVRPCSDGTLRHYQRLSRPCVLGQTGTCAAPCLSDQGYQDRVSLARDVLSGRVKKVREDLRTKMESLSSDLMYEAAARTRDALYAVDALRNQGVFDGVVKPTLALSVSQDRLGCVVQMMLISDGVLVSAPAILCDSPEVDTKEVVSQVLLSSVPGMSPPPRVIVTSDVTDESVLAALSLRSASPRGKLSGVLDLCSKNADISLKRERSSRLSSRDAVAKELLTLKEEFSLPTVPLRIECLDVSHHHGKHTTAAFAVLREGLPAAKMHRSLNIDTGNNDVLSIKTALVKRFEVLKKQQSLPLVERDVSLSQYPDLIVIDGGKPQLDAACEALESVDVTVPVLSLAKHLEEVFLPTSPTPVRLPLNSPALYVLQRARDAAHDLSVRRSRARRLRDLDKTGLEGVPGLGKKRLRRLLDEFSISDLSKMTPDQMPSFLPLSTRDLISRRLQEGS